MNQEVLTAFHFVADTLRDGRPVPADGELLVHDGKVELCAQGLHASIDAFDALQYAPGNTLCLVELSGTIVRGDDKVAASERRIIKRIDAEPLMREFARWSALQVIELWDAPEVVRQYLTTGDESLRDAAWDAAWAAARAAAWDAAWDAAWAAARAAAWAAAWDAAWAAARDAARAAAWAAARAAQRERFNKMVRGAFGLPLEGDLIAACKAEG
ncbi:hypothetical protein G5C63_19610 [Stenotrophomonas pavanii]|uniref:DUF7666 domain-containing protein n=1 Tax=Stenotrophomonas pavanii TaxID=487698 RepID=UPI0013E04509|nr:hypothetical protein [Stenotrophomonas pavanii]NGM56515.1 hypothetical protein [Stenotrophomonas pavanii]